jgi:AcrR family transcriptional regulator
MRDSILASAPPPHLGTPPSQRPGRADQDHAPLSGHPTSTSATSANATVNAATTARPRHRERRTLTRADWTEAALDALARDGLRAVAVEPLAERLGATKGSFYWHFRDRNALLEAAVTLWERTATDELIARLEHIPDPAARHRAVVGWLSDSDRDMRIFMVLLWNADHPVIGPAISRILGKRMAFSLRLREQAGEDAEQAKLSMMYAYSVLLGLQMLRRAAPQLVPEGNGTPQELRDYVAALVRQAAGTDLPTAA